VNFPLGEAQDYTHDGLNSLDLAAAPALGGAQAWRKDFGYDQFANRSLVDEGLPTIGTGYRPNSVAWFNAMNRLKGLPAGAVLRNRSIRHVTRRPSPVRVHDVSHREPGAPQRNARIVANSLFALINSHHCPLHRARRPSGQHPKSRRPCS
jgi:hypothetical protein